MNYESPEIEVIEVTVEAGFATSISGEQAGGNEMGTRTRTPSQTTKVVF